MINAVGYTGNGSELTGVAKYNNPFNQDLNTTSSPTFVNLFASIPWLNGTFLQLSGGNANQNISIGANNFTTGRNITANFYYGNGTYLTGISSSSYEDGWINKTFLWLNGTNSNQDVNLSYNLSLARNYLQWANLSSYAGSNLVWDWANWELDASGGGGGGGGGNPFDQDLNSTDSPTFGNVTVTGEFLGSIHQSPFNQQLNTTSAPTFATVDTGQGAQECYAMDQNVRQADAVTFATVNTGHGANELYSMNQDVETTDGVTFATVNTGQGANELYDMNQNVLTTSSPTFAQATLGGVVSSSFTKTATTRAWSVCISTPNWYASKVVPVSVPFPYDVTFSTMSAYVIGGTNVAFAT